MLAVIFNLIAGITLFLFIIHYIYYIITYLLNNNNNYNTYNKMQSEDAKYIKKRWRGGSIEPHPTEKALIVNYKLEAAVFGEPGDPMLEEKKDCQRIIRLKSLNSKTDPSLLAREVVEKCDLIHKSQISDVEQIIYYLKNRKDVPDNQMTRSQSRLSSGKISPLTTSTGTSGVSDNEKATIRNIDDYIELLYEDLSDRIRGSSLILQLARNPDNLDELEKNEAVLSALSRVLREDWRKSLDLSTNIIYIFFCFSTYTHFHPVIVQYKIGSLCMDVIDYELKRYEQMKNDLDLRKNSDNTKLIKDDVNNKNTNKLNNDYFDTIMNEEKPKEMEPPRRRIPELKQRPKSGNWSSYHAGTSMSTSLLKAKAMNNSYHEKLNDNNIDDNNVNVSLNNDDEHINNDVKLLKKDDLDKMLKQLKIFTKKQEQLLRVAFYLLLNIAENVKLEEKMRRKNIIKMLIKTLDRQNIDLLILIITFLKKLSIVRDNKDDMYELNIIEKLPKLLQTTQPDLIQVTLKLLFNLSFDNRLRSKMIRIGFLPKLVTFLSDDKHHSIVIKILYHMSLDDKVKSMFTYTDCIPLVTDMLLLNLNQTSDLDLISLCINLSLNKRNGQLMIENKRLHNLMSRSFKYQDVLLMKMIRNLSQHEILRIHFIDFVGDLAKIITECDNEEFIVECIGILGNLSLPDLDYSQILHNFNLIPWIRNVLVPGKVKDDLVLDTVVFLGTCACDESCAMLLCKADVILSLIELLKAKQEDDEIVLQIIFVFQQILRNESTRDYMIKETETPAYLIDLMHDKNIEIRKICDYCLDIIALKNNDWAVRIKLEKFRNHNSQWLNMIETQKNNENIDDIDNENDDDYDNQLYKENDNNLSKYLNSDYLEQCFYQNPTNNDNDTDSNFRATSSTSNSRPVSRYSRDFDDFDIMTQTTTSSTKSSRLSSNLDDNMFIKDELKPFDDNDFINDTFLLS